MSNDQIVSNLGARPAAGGVSFRVWAPERESADLVIEGCDREIEMQKGEDGYFSVFVKDLKPRALYHYRLDKGEKLFPDPASRFQPQGPLGPSQVISADFQWSDQNWRGIADQDHIIYEMHIGTFTEEGTWDAAARELPNLKELGITTIEIMPIADFTGRFGWGYDGVNLFAPTRLYGEPDDLRRFIDQAHGIGIAVILDVVYNHFGPCGECMGEFSPYYFSEKYKNDWGRGLNYDGDNSLPVRDFFIQNALYWIEDFHFDGLRLDATQDVKDASDIYIIREIIDAARAKIKHRHLYFVAENEPQDSRFMAQDNDGYHVTAMWNDDFHHTATVALNGRSEAYYTDYKGSPQEFLSAAKYGFLYQGQRYKWQENRRGTPSLNVEKHRFVHFLENHDQVANSGRGHRAHQITSPGRYRALSALLLLLPQTPMLFQGQEFASSHPFFYFADHHDEIAEMVETGRRQFLAQFRSLATEEMSALLPNPADPQTFIRSKLNLNERHEHAEVYNLYKDLIALRKSDAALKNLIHLDGAVLSAESFVLRYFADQEERLLLVNLGRDLHLDPAPEPLLAPPAGRKWNILWSSETPKYGGTGTAHPDSEDNWRLPGHSAIYLSAI